MDPGKLIGLLPKAASVVDSLPPKEWYLSKTVWFNVLTLLGEVARQVFGFHWPINTETYLALATIINLLLRALTVQAIVVKKEAR